MDNPKKKSYREMIEVYSKLPEMHKQRATGIMQGMLMMAEEAKVTQSHAVNKQ